MKALLIEDYQKFKRGQKPSRALNIGVSPSDWAQRIQEKLNQYGIPTEIDNIRPDDKDDEISIIFQENMISPSELLQH